MKSTPSVVIVFFTALFLSLGGAFSVSAQTQGEGALIDQTVAPTHTHTTPHYSPQPSNFLLNDVIDTVLQIDERTDTSLFAPSETLFSRGSCPVGYETPTDQTLVQRINKKSGVAQTHTPHDLVEITHALPVKKDYGVFCLRHEAAHALHNMISDAQQRGLQIIITSAYRSASQQAKLFNEYAPLYNTGTYDRVAPPGHSEHQLGTTVDIAGASQGYLAGYAFAQSPEWRWVRDHAHEYGFVISYAEHAEHLTGYHFEPWHLRYVGERAATVLYLFDHTLAFVNDFRSPAAVLTPLQQVLQQGPIQEIGG